MLIFLTPGDFWPFGGEDEREMMIVVNILVFLVCIPLSLLGLAYIYLAIRPLLKKAMPSLHLPEFSPLQVLLKRS